MSHPRSTCSHADPGSMPATIVCRLKIVPDDSHVGCCAGCRSNTGKVPMDPAVLARIQEQRRGCYGCGDSPLQGI